MLVPIFAGRTSDGELVILYKDDRDDDSLDYGAFNDRKIKAPEDYHLRLPDGELWALEPGAILNYWKTVDENFFHLKVQSSAWTGEVTGGRLELMEAKILDRNRDNA